MDSSINKQKPFWLSKTFIFSTVSFILTLLSLYWKSQGHNALEAAPLVLISGGSYLGTLYGRIKAETELTIKLK